MAEDSASESIHIKEPLNKKDNLVKPMYHLRCKFCRTFLLSSNKITSSHQKDTRECGKCLYLDQDEVFDCWSWIQSQIEASGWTKGRLYCPNKKTCRARIGGFDFVQGVICSCNVLTIPAIWIHSKVDVDIINSNLPSAGMVYGENLTHTSCTELPNAAQASGLRQKVSKPQTKSNVVLKMSEAIGKTVDGTHSSGNGGEGISNGRDGARTIVHKEPEPQSMKEDNAIKYSIEKTDTKDIQTNKNIHTYMALRTMDVVDTGAMQPLNRFAGLPIEEPKLQQILPSKLNEIADDLTCPVCLDCFYEPYKCPCDHVFCEPCLKQLYHSRAGWLRCPVCRSVVDFIEEAKELREKILRKHASLHAARAIVEKNAKYKDWRLPPIGPLSFVGKCHSVVPPQDMTLIKLASVLLSLVCGVILYMVLHMSGIW